MRASRPRTWTTNRPASISVTTQTAVRPEIEGAGIGGGCGGARTVRRVVRCGGVRGALVRRRGVWSVGNTSELRVLAALAVGGRLQPLSASGRLQSAAAAFAALSAQLPHRPSQPSRSSGPAQPRQRSAGSSSTDTTLADRGPAVLFGRTADAAGPDAPRGRSRGAGPTEDQGGARERRGRRVTD